MDEDAVFGVCFREPGEGLVLLSDDGIVGSKRIFLLEKSVGLNDKAAALAAGYSLSVSENTKQRIWKTRVRNEWDRLRRAVANRRQSQQSESQPELTCD